MHEYSIVQSLLDIAKDNAKSNGATKIDKVVVKIGVLSGVEPDLLKIAFDTFKLGTMCEDAVLDIKIQPIKAKCNSCQKISLFEQNQIFFECKHCNDINLDIIDGEDMLLLSLEAR